MVVRACVSGRGAGARNAAITLLARDDGTASLRHRRAAAG